ncbi:MAG TPA: hypothetical protein VH418_01160 [Solirubrobacteraceae bacterium]
MLSEIARVVQDVPPAPAPPAPRRPPAPVVLTTLRPVAAAPPPAPPVDPKPVPAAWPAGTSDAWRCEIEWAAGYRTSRFRAVVRGPGCRRGRVLARSRGFRWLLNSAPRPQKTEHVRAVGELAVALVEAGWQPIEHGGDWYSRRYVWPGAKSPPALHYTS